MIRRHALTLVSLPTARFAGGDRAAPSQNPRRWWKDGAANWRTTPHRAQYGDKTPAPRRVGCRRSETAAPRDTRRPPGGAAAIGGEMRRGIRAIAQHFPPAGQRTGRRWYARAAGRDPLGTAPVGGMTAILRTSFLRRCRLSTMPASHRLAMSGDEHDLRGDHCAPPPRSSRGPRAIALHGPCAIHVATRRQALSMVTSPSCGSQLRRW